jgi:hypothetical protein
MPIFQNEREEARDVCVLSDIRPYNTSRNQLYLQLSAACVVSIAIIHLVKYVSMQLGFDLEDGTKSPTLAAFRSHSDLLELKFKTTVCTFTMHSRSHPDQRAFNLSVVPLCPPLSRTCFLMAVCYPSPYSGYTVGPCASDTADGPSQA